MSKKISEINSNPKPMLYATMYTKLREIAAKFGYALAVHGSLSSDMDLIAVRWSENYESPSYLVGRFIECLVNTSWHGNFYKDITDLTNPEHRYSNQIHYTIPIVDDWFIDLTVIEENEKVKS